MPRFIVTKIQAREENRVQAFEGVDVSTYQAKAPGAPGEVEIATVEADSLEAAQRMVDEIDRVQAVEEDVTLYEHPVSVEDAEPVQASGYSGSYVTADVLRVMGIDKLYDAGRMGQGETVGVVDTPYHVDSLKRLFGDRFKGGKDFSGDGINGPKGTHGTFCAIYATPPKANLLVAAGLGLNGSGQLSDCIEGTQWLADNGATKITSSLGSLSASPAYKALYDKLKARGITLGASAGNDGCKGAGTDNLGVPGRYADYCTAASDYRTSEPASFSSCGPEVDVTAAGVRVQLATGDPELDGKAWSGTSMSCPVNIHGDACLDSGEFGRVAVLQAVLGKARDTAAPTYREGNGWFDGAAALASLKPAPKPPETKPEPNVPTVWLSDLEKYRKPEWFEKPVVAESRKKGEDVVRRFRTVPLEPRKP